MAAPYEQVPLERLITHPDNPRRGDVDAVVASIQANGFYGALVVQRSTHHVLAGNHRLLAARKLEMGTVPVIWVDCDDDRARRILLADNRSSDLAGWDEKALMELLAGFEDLTGTLFDEADLARMFRRWNTEGDPDDVPEAPKVPTTKPGDLWLLGEHRLLCGDSTNPDDVARVMNGQQARLLCTDPPYLVDYTGGNHPQSKVNRAMVKDKTWDDYHDPGSGVEFFVTYLAAALPHLAVDSPIYQWHGDMRRALVDEAWDRNGLLSHQTLYWVKTRSVPTRSDFRWQTEACVYGWRKGHRPQVRRRPPAETNNVWQLDSKGRNDDHPTEKPVQLFTDPYTWHLRAGEIGLEPFSGSGTAIAAAEVTGRRCYALEIEPVYVDVACLRWQRVTGRRPVLESTGVDHDFDSPAPVAR